MSVRALLGGPEYSRLFAQVRERVEAAGFEVDVSGVRTRLARSVTVRGLDAGEQTALAGLLGLKTVSGPTVSIDLARLDAALRASACSTGLEDVLEALGGRLVDRRAVRAHEAAAREQLWAHAENAPGVQRRPVLVSWLAELRQQGLLTRAAKRAEASERGLLDEVLRVVDRLPAPEGTLLPVLAADVLGDAHALDTGRPVAGLVLRAAAHLAGWVKPPTASHERRALWAEVGVLCDPLSSQVLVAGLRPSGPGRVAATLRAAADDGEPLRLTLREIARARLHVGGMEEVFVCENPAVVASAAEALGRACRPLVCTEGVPSVAAWQLLRGFANDGARISFRADFDWAGIRIGNRLAELAGARPWRFGASDYVAGEKAGEGVPLDGEPVVATWDVELRPAMERAGLALFEEQVLAALLEDLGS